jgi:D-3-phosphoglycerate dehydrogenase
MAGEAGQARTVLLCTDKPFAPDAVKKIDSVLTEAKYTFKKLEGYKSKDEVLAAVADCDAMIIRSDIVDKAVLDAAAKLKIVVRAGAGYDNITLPACHEKGVIAMNTPGQNANAVAELVFAMMLTSARNNFDGTSGFELTGKEIAFYGFGAVARAVWKIAQGFGMKAFAYDPYIPKEGIESHGATFCATVEELFEHQYVSLHVPLTKETENSMNRSLLSKMPKNGTLINTARYEVVNESDMLELLKERKDLCYLCDVGVKNLDGFKDAVGDGFGKRVIVTKKKMGAQTTEANNNAGVAAANQIVGFFEKGVTKFALKE